LQPVNWLIVSGNGGASQSMCRHESSFAGPSQKKTKGTVLLQTARRACMMLLRHFFENLVALIFLFEEWGWQPLAELLGSLNRWRPWRLVERIIATLPAYAALTLFVLPTALLFPLKLFALVLITTGHKLAAGVLLLTAKIAGTALLARIFELTQPTLMQIGWFAKTYRRLIPWKNAIHARIRGSWAWRQCRIVKARTRDIAARALTRWRLERNRIPTRVRDLIGSG
jgi:hypothetical protein